MGGYGINVDPLPEMIELTKIDRPRDINICAGVGARRGQMTLYRQGAFGSGLSTVVESNSAALTEKIDIEIIPLKEICEEYIEPGQDIHFLKIDVEGFEKEVLLGADFSIYRPWVICIESTLPGTDIPCHENWESIILEQDYILAGKLGVNRYYVSNEHEYLKERFLTREDLLTTYRIFHAELLMY